MPKVESPAMSQVRSNRHLMALAALFCAALSAADDGLQLGLYLDRKPTTSEIYSNYTAAKFEPLYGCYLGAFIDLDSTLQRQYKDSIGRMRRYPEEFEERVGRRHATYFFYLGYGRPLPTDWVKKLADQKKIVHIALEPNRGIQYVLDDIYLLELAWAMKASGAKIFLRFGSEMNGAWVEYGKDPELYKEKFRLVSEVMKREAPNVAMVWCPYTTPINPIENLYPGDDYVDWVGVNMYSVTFFDQDRNKPASHIHPTEMLDYIYEKYSDRKPIMIGEYGTTHYSALEGKSVPAFARNNIFDLYSGLARKYPRVKAISYFNGNNLELAHRLNNNYAITQNAEVLKAYQQITNVEYYLADDSAATPPATAIGVSPVDGSDASAQVPLAPMLLKDGDTVSGILNLSGWCKTSNPDLRMLFRIDGKELYDGRGKQHWYVTIGVKRYNGAIRIPEGWRTFSVEAWDGDKKIATYSARVLVEH